MSQEHSLIKSPYLDPLVLTSDIALYLASSKREAALKAVLQASQETVASYQRQFESGSKNWQDLMTAAREVASSEANAADARASRISASWKLFFLTEGIESL